jgi:hypothetical protein
MKRCSAFPAIASLLLVSLTTPSPAQEFPKKFSLTLSGGYGTIMGGDIPKVTDGLNATVRDLAAVSDFTVVATLAGAKWGPELEAELLFRPARSFGVSFGASNLRKAEDTRVAAEIQAPGKISLNWAATYQVIPLRLSGCYFFELGQKMTAYAKAGIGYYFGRMTYTFRTEETLLGVSLWEQNEGEATASGLGFHAGLGLEYSLSATFALFIEAAGRYVNLKEWSVENNSSTASGGEHETGIFWYGEELDSALGKYYATLQVSEEKPTNPGLRNVKEAAVGFSGFALKAGLKISF